MFGLAILFLVIALIAYFFGEGHVGEVAIKAAKICFVVALILLLLGFFVGASFWNFGSLGGPYHRTYPY